MKRCNIGSRIKFVAYDFMSATRRDKSSRSYKRIVDALKRLKGTVIETNIETVKKTNIQQFSFINEFSVIKDKLTSKMEYIEIEIPSWLVESIKHRNILTIAPEYFDLRKPLDRRIYELARKHCGNQKEWSIRLELLKHKSGSVSEIRNFRLEINRISLEKSLPQYRIRLDSQKDIVHFERKR